jgi:hypothetical protein
MNIRRFRRGRFKIKEPGPEQVQFPAVVQGNGDIFTYQRGNFGPGLIARVGGGNGEIPEEATIRRVIDGYVFMTHISFRGDVEIREIGEDLPSGEPFLSATSFAFRESEGLGSGNVQAGSVVWLEGGLEVAPWSLNDAVLARVLFNGL